MTMRKIVAKNGKDVILLNPAEKGKKYAKELKDNIHLTNDFAIKKDEHGNSIELNKPSRAYRAGYLASRKDSARAYKSLEAKKIEAKAAKETKKKVSKATTKVHM